MKSMKDRKLYINKKQERVDRGDFMRILFIDIDGVCNAGWAANRPEYKRNGLLFVIPQKLEYVREILERGNAKLVMSSTWRYGYYDLQNGIKSRNADDYLALRDAFAEHGMEFIGHTPITDGGMCRRGKEIDLWLKAWKGEPIESFCVIDDLNGRYLRPHAGRLVRTSLTTGLLPKHVDLAVQILEKPLDKNRPEEPEKKCLYYWTEDGIPELCERQEYTLTEEEWCYHCDRKLPEGERVIGLLAEDGDEYVLCPECAKKACSPA